MLNMVHGGLPMRQNGSDDTIIWVASSRCLFLLKSQCSPSFRVTVRSNEAPGLSPNFAATSAMRGGE